MTPTGAGFAGWSGGCTGTGACVVTLNANTAVITTFIAVSVRTTVTVTKAGNGTGTVTSSPVGLNCGVTCSASLLQGPVIVTATAANGSTFAGWSAGTGNATCTGTNPCDIPLTVDSTVTANVASGNGGGGTVTCSANGGAAGPCSSYLPGTAMVMTATPNSVSNFTGWSGAGCSGTSTCRFTVTAATTVTANFNRPTLTVVVAGTGTVTSDVGGINCGATCSAVLNKGTVVTVTANGTGFTGWSGGGCSGTGTCRVTLTTDTTVTASFGFGTLTVANAPASVDGTFVASGVITPPGGASTIVEWHELNPGTEHGETVTYTLDNRTGEVGVFFVSADGAVSATWLCAPNIVNVNPCAGVSLNRTAGTLTFVNTVLTIVPPPALPLITLNGTLTFAPF